MQSQVTSHELQPFLSWNRWRKSSQENAKVAVSTSRRKAVFYVAWHLIPLSACVVLLILNLRTYFVGEISSTQLTAFQFAAKLQELLIQASIATILFSFIRQRLLKADGIAFGSLLASLQIQSISGVWLQEIWGSLTSYDIDRWQRMVVGPTICLAVILAALVGPSTAILTIPRPVLAPAGQWVVFMDEPAILHPKEFNDKNVRLFNETILTQAISQLADYGQHDMRVLSDHYGIRQIANEWVSDYNDSAIVCAIASRATAHALQAPALQESFDADSYSTVFTADSLGPMVYASCSSQDYNNGGDPENTYVDFHADLELSNWITVADVWRNATEILDEDLTMLEVHYFQDVPSEISHNHSIIWISAEKVKNSSGEAWITSCLIDAYWARSTVNWTGQSNNIEIALEESQIQQRPSKDNLVTINSTWADKIIALFLRHNPDLRDFFPNLAVALAMSDAMPDFQIVDDPFNLVSTNWSEFGVLTEDQTNIGLKYVQQSGLKSETVSFATSTNWTDPSKLTQQVVRGFKPGYGYDSATITVRLSLAVLGLYCLVTATFIVHTIVAGETSNSWNSVGKLVTLALNSHYPSHMGKTGAGIETCSPYREPVSVRINGQDEPELVFAKDPVLKFSSSYSYVEADKAY